MKQKVMVCDSDGWYNAGHFTVIEDGEKIKAQVLTARPGVWVRFEPVYEVR